MGGTYAYLMSSLPNLTFRSTPEAQQEILGLLRKYVGVTSADQRATELLDQEAQKFLPPAVFATFEKMNWRNIHELAFQEGTSQVLTAFSRLTLALKNELRLWRRGDATGKQPNIADLLGTGTPLDKEIRIMQYQWQQLEDLAAGHFANLEAVFAYKIQLLLLERWWSFNAEQGWAKFSQLTANN